MWLISVQNTTRFEAIEWNIRENSELKSNFVNIEAKSFTGIKTQKVYLKAHLHTKNELKRRTEGWSL